MVAFELTLVTLLLGSLRTKNMVLRELVTMQRVICVELIDTYDEVIAKGVELLPSIEEDDSDDGNLLSIS